jgi:hypothetical protein
MEFETWVFRVEPHPEESFGHFMGRFRRANELSHKTIAEHLGIRLQWVQDWDAPSRRRNPTSLQLVALSKLVEVSIEQRICKVVCVKREILQRKPAFKFNRKTI